MLKFNEEEQIKAIKGALALRPQVEKSSINFMRKNLTLSII